MGTRNLTMVINEVGETKVAQYGQWDGYPSGQGATILNFLKERKAELKEAIENVKWVDDDEVDNYLRSIGCADGWMNMEQSSLFNKRFPFLSRDHGGKILELICDADSTPELRNASSFKKDGLFCEWAYTVDFQNNKLIVEGGKEKSFSLSKLPSEKNFLKALEEEE